MTITAQYIFGSHARRDNSENSDLDLLSITTEPKFRSFSHGSLNVSFYPENKFLNAALAGDLFVMHIVREAVLVYDENKFHPRLLRSFKYRSDYSKEIRQAADIGWFIIDHGNEVKSAHILNRRIAWCVRTILIAQTAMAGSPVFDAQKLAVFSEFREIEELLEAKNSYDRDFGKIKLLQNFLEANVVARKDFLLSASIKDYWYYFRRDNNAIALKLIDNAIDSVSKDIYLE